MRWLCGRIVGVTLLVAVAAGCGSTSGNDDVLVFHFLRFDNTGITQADSVGETSANVDIVQNVCLSGNTITAEPFTVTTINAVFRNEEAADMQLEQVVIDVGPKAGRATITHQLSGDLPGGRCSNIDQQCASDADCISTTSTGTGSCVHTETTINDILLFDFDDKAHILPGTYSVIITFFASDAVRSFQISTNYVVTFEDFNNCPSSTGSPTPTPTVTAG